MEVIPRRHDVTHKIGGGRSLGEVHSCGPYVARRWLRRAQSAARASVHRAVRAGHDHHAECARLGVSGPPVRPRARVRVCAVRVWWGLTRSRKSLSRYLRLFFIYRCGVFFLAFSQSERLELSRAQENTPKRPRRTWAKTRRLPDGSPLRMSPAWQVQCTWGPSVCGVCEGSPSALGCRTYGLR